MKNNDVKIGCIIGSALSVLLAIITIIELLPMINLSNKNGPNDIEALGSLINFFWD